MFTSGTGAGLGAVTNDADDVESGFEAGQVAGGNHLRALHWGLDPFGTLNDIWYCVKVMGMVNSHGGGSFSQFPRVVDGYSKAFHDVFGGRFLSRRRMAWTARCQAGRRAARWPVSTCRATSRSNRK